MHNRSAGVRGMVFGGIMAGLVLVFSLVPFLSVLIPVPLVLTYVRYGGRTALLTGIAAGLLTAMFKGVVVAFLVTVPAGILPAMAFGYGFRHKLRPMSIWLLAVAVFFVGYAANYAVTRVAFFDGRDPFEMALEAGPTKDLFNKMVSDMEKTLDTMAANGQTDPKAVEANKALFADLKRDPVGFTWALLPMMVFAAGAFNSWVNYVLCRWTLPRFGHPVPQPAPFSEFRLPAWLVWVFLTASLASGFVGRQSLLEGAWWVKLLWNVLPTVQYFFIAYGLAVAYGWLRIKQSLSKGVAVMISLAPLLLLGLNGIFLYVMLAMWDTIFDFRGLGHGLWKRPQETP